MGKVTDTRRIRHWILYDIADKIEGLPPIRGRELDEASFKAYVTIDRAEKLKWFVDEAIESLKEIVVASNFRISKGSSIEILGGIIDVLDEYIEIKKPRDYEKCRNIIEWCRKNLFDIVDEIYGD